MQNGAPNQESEQGITIWQMLEAKMAYYFEGVTYQKRPLRFMQKLRGRTDQAPAPAEAAPPNQQAGSVQGVATDAQPTASQPSAEMQQATANNTQPAAQPGTEYVPSSARIPDMPKIAIFLVHDISEIYKPLQYVASGNVVYLNLEQQSSDAVTLSHILDVLYGASYSLHSGIQHVGWQGYILWHGSVHCDVDTELQALCSQGPTSPNPFDDYGVNRMGGYAQTGYSYPNPNYAQESIPVRNRPSTPWASTGYNQQQEVPEVGPYGMARPNPYRRAR